MKTTNRQQLNMDKLGFGLFLSLTLAECLRYSYKDDEKVLKDWMIDRKWTKARRDETPIFVDGNDSILWVPGFPPCDAMKITPSTTSVIRLTYSHTET